MRILAAIPQYFHAEGGKHASLRDPAPRLEALVRQVAALHSLFGRGRCMLRIADRTAVPAGQAAAGRMDVVYCTTGDRHLLDTTEAAEALAPWPHTRRDTGAAPLELGYACRRVLAEELGHYDYYCFLEDDLVLHDPLFFVKLTWFTAMAGDQAVLMPQRFERVDQGAFRKVYIDGDLRPEVTRPFQNPGAFPELRAKPLGMPTVFRRALNPHAGCFFLTGAQMARLADTPDFLTPETAFIGPLESAATLSVMRHFRVYKCAPEHAAFLEIEHAGAAFASLLGKGVAIPPELLDRQGMDR